MLDVEAWFKELQQAGHSPASLVFIDPSGYQEAWQTCCKLRRLHPDLCFNVSARSTGDGSIVRLVYSSPKKE